MKKPAVQKALLPLLLLVLLLATLFGSFGFGTSRTSASANTSSWNQPINSFALVSLISNDSAVFVGNCVADKSQIFVGNEYNNTGSLAWNVPSSANPLPCSDYRTEAIDSAGAVYTIVSNPQSGISQVAKFLNGSMVWSITPPHSQAILALGLGSDGNIYGVYDTTGNTGGTIGLFGVTPGVAAGASVPAIVLDKALTYHAIQFGWFAPYYGGLAIVIGNVGIKYYNYSGALLNTVGAGLSTTGPFVVSVSGDAFLLVPTQSQACPMAVDKSIAAFSPSGALWTYPLPACSVVEDIRPLPNGGAIALIASNDGLTTSRYFLALNDTGGISWKTLMPYTTSGDTLANPVFKVTAAGDIVYVQQYVQADNNYGVVINVLSESSGASLYGYGFSPTPTSGGYDLTFNDIQTFAIAKGMIYINLGHCMYSTNGGAPGCGGQTIYALGDPILALDYPRSSLLEASQPLLTYVGMGDSFSAGEGNPPFLPPTNTDGCDRSADAYPVLLSKDGSLHLQLNFVACSGYTTNDVIKGKNETSQLTALNSSTQVVTISIGGNDVDFAHFAAQCVLADCSIYRSQYLNRVANLGSALSSLYGMILAKAPNAKIYVVGYPMLLNPSGCSQTDVWMQLLNQAAMQAKLGNKKAIAYLRGLATQNGLNKRDTNYLLTSGKAEISLDEQTLIHDFTTDLDRKFQSVVRSMGSHFLYVDPLANNSPFIGHELCTNTPYFNALDKNNSSYSFHPNQLGQDAYRILVQEAMSQS